MSLNSWDDQVKKTKSGAIPLDQGKTSQVKQRNKAKKAKNMKAKKKKKGHPR